MTRVLDACGVLAYYRDEPGAEEVAALIEDPSEELVIHAVNACEVYYIIRRERLQQGVAEAVEDELFEDLRADGIHVDERLSPEFLARVGRMKTDARIPFADCFCAALAESLGAAVLTTDRNHFQAVADAGICEVQFIR